MSHIPSLDPNVAAQKGFRESEERIKRFWKAAEVEARDGGWVVLLDGRAPKTPGGVPYDLPTEAAARLVADEWAALKPAIQEADAELPDGADIPGALRALLDQLAAACAPASPLPTVPDGEDAG